MSDDSTTNSNSRRSGPPALAVAALLGALVSGGLVWSLVGGTGAPAAAEADEHSAELPPGIVEIPEAAQQNAGVTMAEVQLATLPVHLEVTGAVAPEGSRIAEVRPLARGLITQVSVRLGDRVKAGQALLTYDNIQLGERLGEYFEARAGLRQVESDVAVKQRAVERAEALIGQQAISQQVLDLRRAEYKNALAAVDREKATLDRIDEQIHRFGLTDQDLEKLGPDTPEANHRAATLSTIRAPFDGVITAYDVAVGEIVEPERALVTIANLATVWILADVYEKDLARVPSAADVEVRVVAYADQVFKGRLTYVSDVIDPQSRSAKVRSVVENPDGLLRLDMFARVSIPTKDQQPSLAIPIDAVQQIDGQAAVFIRESATRFRRQNVQLGLQAGNLIEVKAGLKAGDTIVAAGSFYFKTALQRELIGDGH
ncbi:MAG: efflux RND transporter periplasmic adaptor subunit [Acidobacteriota bacterium]|nr:efflux RND transporter periplasmic adaptor subunit [Acidobacteriota bacterium]